MNSFYYKRILVIEGVCSLRLTRSEYKVVESILSSGFLTNILLINLKCYILYLKKIINHSLVITFLECQRSDRNLLNSESPYHL